jgi:hypothetical protein
MTKYSIYEAFKDNWHKNEALRVVDDYVDELYEYYGLEVKENDLWYESFLKKTLGTQHFECQAMLPSHPERRDYL